MANPTANPVVSICIRGPELEHNIEIAPGQARQYDVNEICPEAKTSNTAIGYSGRHDDGSLAALRNSGPLLEVVSSLKDAKEACDVYLTSLIDGAPDCLQKKARLENSTDSNS